MFPFVLIIGVPVLTFLQDEENTAAKFSQAGKRLEMKKKELNKTQVDHLLMMNGRLLVK